MGSLFDGIGGFPLAAVRNGIKPLWASEIEAFPIEVTKIRFPDMLHVGDITKLNGATLPPVDVICGGSPCQDLSVAGQRRGLAGERSGLFMEQTRIAKEMRKADEQRGIPAHLVRPRYLVWENVPGAFSSAEGEDFRAVIEEIIRIKYSAYHVPRPDTGSWQSAGAAVLGNEFSLAWRVLDAQFWGVAQRRRRIFLVADFGGSTAPQILFEQDRLFGDFAPCRGEGQGASSPAQGSADDTDGTLGVHHFCGSDRQATPAAHLTGGNQFPPCAPHALRGGVGPASIAFAANQRDEVIDLHGISGALLSTRNMQMQTFVAQDPLLCLNDQGGNRMDVTEEVSSTLRAGMGGHPPLVSQPNCLNGWDTQQSRVFTPEGIAPTLAGADGGGGRNPAGLLFAAAFCGNAGAEARGIGYQDECSPTIKTGAAPTALCLNDQGGNVMSCSENVTGTLRAQEHGHQPLVMATQQGGAKIGEGICPTITASAGMSGNNQPVLFENHGIDARYTGPHMVAPTMSARMGTGGNNVPLVGSPVAFSLDSKESNSMKSANPHSGCRETDNARTIDTGSPDPSKNQGGIAILQETICIAGNTIDRQPQNGGNGLGCQTDVAYTLTATDHHAVYEPYQKVVGALCRGDEKGCGGQYVNQDKCIVDGFGIYGQSQFGNYAEGCTTLRAQGGDNGGGSENLVAEVGGTSRKLIRRLTPLECERLQGFPDGWTLIPGASDSARYKALGNSVAIPCVSFLMRGIAYFLRKIKEDNQNEQLP
nr:DNA (cytosine-5-)-methyltransferase [Pygmaiobacter massiliensis]